MFKLVVCAIFVVLIEVISSLACVIYALTTVSIVGQPAVPLAVLVPPVAMLPSIATASVAVGGHSIVAVGIVPVGVPGLVNVIVVTLPNVLTVLASVPIVQVAVAPEPPAIVMVGAGAVPLPYPPPESVIVNPVTV
jgi:hypothetical protein